MNDMGRWRLGKGVRGERVGLIILCHTEGPSVVEGPTVIWHNIILI